MQLAIASYSVRYQSSFFRQYSYVTNKSIAMNKESLQKFLQQHNETDIQIDDDGRILLNGKTIRLEDINAKLDSADAGILKTAVITDEANARPACEERKRQTSEELTWRDKRGYKQYESSTDRVLEKEERSKGKNREKALIKKISTSEEEEDPEQGCYSESSSMSDPKQKKRKDPKQRNFQKKGTADKEKQCLPHEVACSDSYSVQRLANPQSIAKGHCNMMDDNVNDFTFAENQGSVKHVLVLGTIGSGKYTIAKNITKNYRSFPSRNNSGQSEIVQYFTDGRFKFVLVNTGGARMPDVWGRKGPTMGKIATSIKQYLQSGISLIMVVVRYGCVTPEDLHVLVNMINGLFTEEAKEHIALIHNGCESVNKEQYIEHFKADGPSRQLASLCRKCTIATGFPNLQETKPDMTQYFEQTVEESKRKLSDLVESCRFLQPYSDILKANDDPSRAFPESKPDCCVM